MSHFFIVVLAGLILVVLYLKWYLKSEAYQQSIKLMEEEGKRKLNNLSSEFKSELVKLDNIKAIKLLRETVNCDLAEGKYCVELLQKEAGKIND